MPSYTLRFPRRADAALATLTLPPGNPQAALHLAQRNGCALAELLADGRSLCTLELDRGSGFWVIAAGTGATGVAAA